jgi:hypothetical protein
MYQMDAVARYLTRPDSIEENLAEEIELRSAIEVER